MVMCWGIAVMIIGYYNAECKWCGGNYNGYNLRHNCEFERAGIKRNQKVKKIRLIDIVMEDKK